MLTPREKVMGDVRDGKTGMRRRRFLQILALGAGAGSLTAAGLGSPRNGARRISETRAHMGTLVSITVISTDERLAQKAVTSSLDRMKELELVLSRFDPNSQVSQLNRTGWVANAHPALVSVLQQAQHVSEISGGAFDITVKPLVELYQERFNAKESVPHDNEIAEVLSLVDYRKIMIDGRTVSLAREGMGITLDGMAKGYIVDAGVAALRKEGFWNVLLEAGGDLVASGFKEGDRSWEIGVRSPRAGQSSVLETLSVQDRGVATSGDYLQAYSADLQHHHIIDPRSGRSPRRAASVTIAAPTCALADGLSTAMMVLGRESGGRMLGQVSECEGVLVTKDMKVFRV